MNSRIHHFQHKAMITTISRNGTGNASMSFVNEICQATGGKSSVHISYIFFLFGFCKPSRMSFSSDQAVTKAEFHEKPFY
ncbi:CLUMA_CG019357, isoform A [Clunio marinus]|uniref:CLUMA_CG019357, isoform A n=1 Tax=Clunio marinus TaxID=568069 RepID=A0A1J1J0V7_9DIPT|nr:CLUMA_CG019357, isoform A [Clunio marinus]